MLRAFFKRRRLHGKRLKKVPCVNVFKLAFAALPTIAFGVFTIVFTLQQDASARATREQDQRQVDEQNRRLTYKDYIDDVKEILLNGGFENNTERSLSQIRAQTLTALENLDPKRKRDVIRFLFQNRLLQQNRPFRVLLTGADLTGVKFTRSELQFCHFDHLYLSGIYAKSIVFEGCSLRSAVFQGASMPGAQFHSCTLVESVFRNTNLSGAKMHDNHMFKADFAAANLVQSSIKGVSFQGVDFTNADLFQSDVSDRLLYPVDHNILVPNTFLNTRFSDGSFSDIDTNDLIVGGQAQTQCSQNWTTSWHTRFMNSSGKTVHSVEVPQTETVRVGGDCFFRIDNQSSVFQLVTIIKFSVLIDQQQAMFNLSARVGLRYPNKTDTIIMLALFSESADSIEFTDSARKEIQGSSTLQTHSLSQLIPPNIKYLVVWFTCEVFSSQDQFCIFDQVKLTLFQQPS